MWLAVKKGARKKKKKEKDEEENPTKTLLRAKDCVRDDEKCEGFLLDEVHVGPGEGGGARGGPIQPPRNLSIPIASSLLLHTVHSSVTVLQMEAVIINHHSHSTTSSGKVLTKGLNRCCTPTHGHHGAMDGQISGLQRCPDHPLNTAEG